VKKLAGHSKWKNIQHRKGRQDAMRGKIFAKLGREIYVAARQGDKDPAHNQRLRLAITKAKAQNMPNENIQRALKKAAGSGDGKEYEEIIYEGYGPGGIAVMVEALTDNRNRTAADIRYLFAKHGGSMGETGCVSWMFDRKALFAIDRETTPIDEDTLVMHALENGADDFEMTEKGYTITTAPEAFTETKQALEDVGIRFSSAEVTFIPSNKIYLQGEAIREILRLMEAFEEHDDVQDIYANFDVDEEEWAKYDG
jgi:YebC/PmpR family DNA-binding regulatory protein